MRGDDSVKKVFVLVVLLALIMCLTPAAMAKKVPDYFPLAVGYWWKYKNVEKGWTFTIKVTGIEEINGMKCYKVETEAANGKVSLIDYYAKKDGKVYLVKEVYATSKMEAKFDPIREFLHNPLKVGDKWIWKGKGMMGIEIEDSKQVTKKDSVVVPAGKFNAALVESKIIQGGQETNKAYWYAPNVGLVKSQVKTSTYESNMVLVKYNLKSK